MKPNFSIKKSIPNLLELQESQDISLVPQITDDATQRYSVTLFSDLC